MSIQTLPASPAFREHRFTLRGNTREHTSPLTRSVQVLEFTGARWLASFALPPMARATAETWLAWLANLQGRQGRFYAGPPDGTAPRGVATGTPLVKGASQTGKSLITDGWTNSVTGILLAGDYLAFDTPSGWRELHMVTADANSSVAGEATLTLAPPIRESPADNAALILASPTCVVALASDDEASWSADVAHHYEVRFNAQEAFRESA